MQTIKSTALALLSLTLFCTARAFASDDAPQWLRQAAAATAPSYDSKVKAVVLLDESRVAVEEGGKVITSHLYAVRILTREGKKEAFGRVVYQTGTGKVKELHGWMIRPNGEAKKLGKDRVADIAVAANDVYNDVRAQIVDGEDDADPNAVFGYESVLEDKNIFTQFTWDFQDATPALVSRFSISVPAGWKAEGILYNHAKMEPSASGNSYTWELRDLPPVDREPSRPGLASIVPWLAVSVVPASGANTGIGKAFANWQDVSRWIASFADPQAEANAELTQKAQALTRDAKSDLDKIAAIGKYAQGVKYVSIQMGVGRGGGYKPHSAVEVFTKAYGDCKDKANLMRAMLKTVGIDAYLMVIYSGDASRVREEWASPQQFNHAIVAVRVKDDVKLPAVGTYPVLGRLLFFDPTDEITPVGLIPEDEEASFALLVAPEQGALLRMPVSSAETNRLERKLDLTLADDGTLSGTVEEMAYGHHGAEQRRRQQYMSKPEYRKRIERWISETGSGASVDTIDLAEAPAADGGSRMVTAFKTPRYAKLMQGSLLVVKSGVLPAHGVVYLTEQKRKYPVVLTAESFAETMRMKLPPNFELDELPRPVITKTAFGAYSFGCESKEGYLTCKRALSVNAGVVQVEKYKEARDFFALVNGSGNQPAVLQKK